MARMVWRGCDNFHTFIFEDFPKDQSRFTLVNTEQR